MRGGERHPWTALERLQPDKFLSDVVESVVGAIFVDGEGDLGACREFAERIGLAAYLERAVAGEVDVVHPRRTLEALAGGVNAVAYEFSEQEDSGEKRFGCSIKVAGEAVAEVGGCRSKDEAMIAAAAEAAERMRANHEVKLVE